MTTPTGKPIHIALSDSLPQPTRECQETFPDPNFLNPIEAEALPPHRWRVFIQDNWDAIAPYLHEPGFEFTSNYYPIDPGQAPQVDFLTSAIWESNPDDQRVAALRLSLLTDGEPTATAIVTLPESKPAQTSLR